MQEIIFTYEEQYETTITSTLLTLKSIMLNIFPYKYHVYLMKNTFSLKEYSYVNAYI